MKSIIVSALFAIIGCKYVGSFQSESSDVQITLICICIPFVAIVVFTACHTFIGFMSDGFKEADRKIKERCYRENYRI